MFQTPDRVTALLTRWRRRVPSHTGDSLPTWFNIFNTRLMLLGQLEQRLQVHVASESMQRIMHSNTLDGRNVMSDLNAIKFSLVSEKVASILQISRECIERNRDVSAKEYMKIAKRIFQDEIKNPADLTQILPNGMCLVFMNTIVSAEMFLRIAQNRLLSNTRNRLTGNKVTPTLKVLHRFFITLLSSIHGTPALVPTELHAAYENLARGLHCLANCLAAEDSEKIEPRNDVLDCMRLVLSASPDTRYSEIQDSSSTTAYRALMYSAGFKAGSDLLPPGWEARNNSGKTVYLNIFTGVLHTSLPNTALLMDGNKLGGAKEYLALSSFLEQMIVPSTDISVVSTLALPASRPKLVHSYIECVLAAMQINSGPARQKFPKLLQLLESSGASESKVDAHLLAFFVEKAALVPVWMFIPWISQMTAFLDRPTACAVYDILNRMAHTYPHALVYPFGISSEGFKLTDRINRQEVEKLKAVLKTHCTIVEKFIENLRYLTNPEHIFRDFYDDVLSRLKSADDRAGVLTRFDVLMKDFAASKSVAPEWHSYMLLYGKLIADSYGAKGEKLKTMKEKDFILDYRKSLSNVKSPVKNLLKEYSSWLSDFQANNFPEGIEIPGQYSGNRKPQPEYHVKVQNFDQRILVLTSIRRPKRLIIRGSDEKEYPFLIKGGEDLRLDQRIEQVFSIMNDIVSHDDACASRNLTIRTYQVIPMTTRLGIIEWMSHTTPLKDVLTPNKVLLTKMEENKSEYLAWLTKYGKNTDSDLTNSYYTMYNKVSRAEVETQMMLRQGNIHEFLLRDTLLGLSVSAEAYLTTRTRFGRSLSTNCIFQYILGIGDRHLSNIMLDTHTGSLVPIDFGHAFGSAVQNLEIPELMPFRLTRQLTSVMKPHGCGGGLLKQSMVYVLDALQKNKEIILSIMDVFVKEPLIEWLALAKSKASDSGRTHGSETSDSTSSHPSEVFAWYPTQKIEIAKKKLSQMNPAFIILDELETSKVKAKPCYIQIKAVAMGNDRLRGKSGKICTSVSEQV